MSVCHIVLDLEMNPTSKALRKQLSTETVEIGAVKLNDQLETVDTFHCFVKPQHSKAISSYITDLTGITAYNISDAVPFESALQSLGRWIGFETPAKIYSWSTSDKHQLQTEAAFKAVQLPDNMEHWIDLQAMYAQEMGYGKKVGSIALHTAAEQFGIYIDNRKIHSALYDSEITAKILVSVLQGECQKQAAILSAAVQQKPAESSFSLADSCGDVLQQLLREIQDNSVAAS